MPQDNTNDFFKKKLAELDQTVPPEVTWNKAQGWQQLQPTLPIKRHRKVVWYQVAAAVAILVSGLFLLNVKSKKAIVNSPQTAVVKQNLKLPLMSQPVVKLAEEIPVKNSGARASNKVRIPKNLKKSLQKEPVFANKPSKHASEQDSRFDQNRGSLVTNNQEAPSETLPETLPPVQTPIKITVVLGGQTTRQLAVYAAKEAAKVNRRKNNRLKVQVNLPNEAYPDDSALAASVNLLPNRSAISAKIDL